jgi:hypothetical protein
MQIYTAIILNTAARATAPDRMDCKSFQSFDSAMEYLIDFLVDEGFVDMDEVPDVEMALENDHVYVAVVNDKELRIEENELCDW